MTTSEIRKVPPTQLIRYERGHSKAYGYIVNGDFHPIYHLKDKIRNTHLYSWCVIQIDFYFLADISEFVLFRMESEG